MLARDTWGCAGVSVEERQRVRQGGDQQQHPQCSHKHSLAPAPVQGPGLALFSLAHTYEKCLLEAADGMSNPQPPNRTRMGSPSVPSLWLPSGSSSGPHKTGFESTGQGFRSWVWPLWSQLSFVLLALERQNTNGIPQGDKSMVDLYSFVPSRALLDHTPPISPHIPLGTMVRNFTGQKNPWGWRQEESAATGRAGFDFL